MSKNIYYDNNLLYYYYLIDLKYNLILNDEDISNLDKRIENFNFLIKQLIYHNNYNYYNIYGFLNKLNEQINNFNINKDYLSLEKKEDFSTYIKNIRETLNLVKNGYDGFELPRKRLSQLSRLALPEPPQKTPLSVSKKKLPAAPKMLNLDLVLINPVGDGDCFINAIFDYGLYTNKIHKIFNKLLNIENYIQKNLSSYNNNNEINNLIYNFNEKNKKIYIDEYYNNKKFYENITNNSIWKVDKIEDKFKINYSLKYYYTHKDQVNRNSYYDSYRLKFIIYMKYIWALYCYSIYYNEFKKKISDILVIKYTDDMKIIYPKEIATYIKQNFYDENDNIKPNINYDILVTEYIRLYYETDKIYSSYFEIAIFTIMFKQKIDENDTEIFEIDHQKLNNIKNNIKNNYKNNPTNNNNISIILENNDHFLLCLYYYEMLSIFKLR
jgi:hypothetical protein